LHLFGSPAVEHATRRTDDADKQGLAVPK
jgi:hypothetical protein